MALAKNTIKSFFESVDLDLIRKITISPRIDIPEIRTKSTNKVQISIVEN